MSILNNYNSMFGQPPEVLATYLENMNIALKQNLEQYELSLNELDQFISENREAAPLDDIKFKKDLNALFTCKNTNESTGNINRIFPLILKSKL